MTCGAGSFRPARPLGGELGLARHELGRKSWKLYLALLAFDGAAASVSFQNCRSPITVTLIPSAASRRTSISFDPPSLPAICCAFGRPRTRMSVDGPGLDCTFAPAFLAAPIASAR